jgi:hypothetical protein
MMNVTDDRELDTSVLEHCFIEAEERRAGGSRADVIFREGLFRQQGLCRADARNRPAISARCSKPTFRLDRRTSAASLLGRYGVGSHDGGGQASLRANPVQVGKATASNDSSSA